MALYRPWARVGTQSARSWVWGNCAFEYDSVGQDHWKYDGWLVDRREANGIQTTVSARLGFDFNDKAESIHFI